MFIFCVFSKFSLAFEAKLDTASLFTSLLFSTLSYEVSVLPSFLAISSAAFARLSLCLLIMLSMSLGSSFEALFSISLLFVLFSIFVLTSLSNSSLSNSIIFSVLKVLPFHKIYSMLQ